MKKYYGYYKNMRTGKVVKLNPRKSEVVPDTIFYGRKDKPVSYIKWLPSEKKRNEDIRRLS